MILEEKRFSSGIFIAALLAIAALSIYTISPYLNVLVFAAIFAIVFYPLFKTIKRKVKSDTWSALVITLLLIIIVLGPVAFFVVKIIQESSSIYPLLKDNDNISNVVSSVSSRVNSHLPKPILPTSININQYIKAALDWIANNLNNIFSKAFTGVASFIFFFFAFFYFIKDGDKFLKSFHYYSPLKNEDDQEVFKRIQSSVNSVVKGALLVAIIQGIAMGIGLLIFKIPHIFLLSSATAIAALVPLFGTGLIWVPLVIYLFLIGNNFAAIGLFIWGALIVSSIDHFVRSYLIGKSTNVPSLLILFSVLGGIEVFGFIGFLLGPAIIAILFALLDAYPIIFKKETE